MLVKLEDSDGVKVTLNRDEYSEIVVNNIMVVIKHNDVGISIDTYSIKDKDIVHKNEEQVWFEDFK